MNKSTVFKSLKSLLKPLIPYQLKAKISLWRKTSQNIFKQLLLLLIGIILLPIVLLILAITYLLVKIVIAAHIFTRRINIYALLNAMSKIINDLEMLLRKTEAHQYERELYLVKPEEIKYAAKKEFNIFRYKNLIVSGDWDNDYVEFSGMDVYTSYKKKIEKGIPIENTEFYQRVLVQIKKGKSKWNCKNKTELDERFKKLQLIYEDMKNNGYKIDAQDDQVTVNIARNGVLLFNNGRHRLTFAKILNLEKIPIKVSVRHKEWLDFKRRILDYAALNNGLVYAPIPHFDLAGIPSLHNNRFEIIKEHLDSKSGTLLDIGAHWGYFCHMFEDLGFECFAVENYQNNFYFLEKLKIAKEKKFHIVKEDIFSFVNKRNKFNVVLALSIFHWFIREEKACEEFKKMLKALDMQEMFFQPHSPDHTKMQDSFLKLSPEDFVKFIIEYSCLNNYELIGEEGGRKIYKIYK